MKSYTLFQRAKLLSTIGIACALLILSPDSQAQQIPPGTTGPSFRMAKGAIRALYGIKSGRFQGSPEEAARAFLAERKSSLRVESTPASLKTRRVERVPGGTHVRFLQIYQGIPVYHGGVVVSMNEANQVGMVVTAARSEIRLGSVSPAFGQENAVRIARTLLNARSPALGGSERAELTVFRMPDGEDRLAYCVTSVLEAPPGDWEVIIDAQTGKELAREDRYVNNHADAPYVAGSGFVYRRNPLSAARRHYGDPGFANNNNADSDSLDAYRRIVTLDSLTQEGGFYRLSGPSCIITDLESPADSLYGETSPDGFTYHRSQPGFEAVMAYYHVTLAHQRLRDLGFDPPTLYSLRVDPHGYQGKDNSHYSPGGNWIAFGTGGVEDAEDADVIWHEYGHAIQYNIIPFWGGGECAALGEGFSDYWAGSYGRSLQEWSSTDPEYQWIFGWDGHNPYWSGRILNDQGRYPFPPGSIYSGGQIWSSTLMGIQEDLGRDVTDRLVIKSLYYLGAEVTATDNAEAILQADRDLYGGAHLPTLMYWLQTVKNFIPATATNTVLVVSDEFPLTTGGTGTKGIDTSLAGIYKTFSSVLPSLPLAASLDLQATTFADLDTNALATARALVLLGGANSLPFDDASKRQAIVNYVEQGGRVLVEGGEVGYIYRWAANGRERDSTFRKTVLHARTYLGDGSGTSLLPGGDDGSLFSQPHMLSTPVNFVSSPSSAVRDMMEAVEEANTVILGTWSDGHRTDAVIAHLDDSGGVRTMYLPFSLALLADSSVASQLAENALSFLLYHQQQTTAAASAGEPLPTRFQLHQNYPNPFNPATTFVFDLSKRCRVLLEVFSILGQKVGTVAEGEYAAGRHELHWEASTQGGGHLSSGTYILRLTAESDGGRRESSARTMALIR
jgi:hypothetical protein